MGEDPIDARETELGPSSGGLELFVRCVNDRTCFVALPRSVADAVARRNPRVPLPLALAPRKSPTHSGERRSNSTRRGDAADASPAQSSPLFVAWAGAVGQVEGHVEIPLALADCLGLRDGDAVRVSGRPSAPTASFVNLRPETEQDWEAVVAAADELETSALRQVGCVAVGQSFPFWPATAIPRRKGGGDEDETSASAGGSGPLRVVACAASPSAPGGVARLGLDTELRVAPWTPETDPGAREDAREEGKEKDDALPAGTEPAMLRVQSSRGVVAAWPRRLRGAGAARVGGVHEVGSPAVAVSAAPTAAAFVSARTSRALGLEDGAVVEVSRRAPPAVSSPVDFSVPGGTRTRVGSANGATRVVSGSVEERPVPLAASWATTGSATLRATATDAESVADGHVVLSRAVCDALGAEQGDRVFVRELREASLVTASRTREEAASSTAGVSVTGRLTNGAFASRREPRAAEPPPAAASLRLRPVRSERSRRATRETRSVSLERSERPAPSDDDDDFARFLEPAHRAALGVPLECDRAAVDAAAARLTMRWIKTQAAFFGKRGATRAGDARRRVPVRTGTLLRFSLVAPNASSDSSDSETTATFAVEARVARGNGAAATALFDADELFGDDAGDEEDAEDARNFARAARVALGPPAEVSPAASRAVAGIPRGRNANVNANANALFSKRIGDAVATRAPLDARREPPLGAQAATAVASATARLKAALRGGEVPVRAGDTAAVSVTVRSPTTGGALFWGAPGSGRSAAARETARRLRDDAEINAAVVFVECARIPAQGDARPAIAALRRAAEEASRRAPAAVVLDDLDAVCDAERDASREGGEPEGGAGRAPSPAALVAEALGDLMDATGGFSFSGANNKVAWIATARNPRALAAATLSAGRFDHEAELKAPEALAGRVDAFAAAAEARGTPIADAAESLVQVAREAEGYARGDFDALVERAASEAASGWFREDGAHRAGRGLRAADLLAARRDFVPAPERALGPGRRARGDRLGPDDAVKNGGLESVGGLKRAKEALVEALSLPSRHPAVFQNAPLRLRTGALLYGPPGCGKTLLARAAAEECGARLVAVKGPELLNKYIGQSEAGVRAAFTRAASAKPCALFFDEFDAIAPRRGHDTTGVTDRVVNAFLTELDGVESLEGVVVLAATSRPDLIDPALLRPGRLDRMLPCPFPTEEERLEILRALAGTGTPAHAAERDVPNAETSDAGTDPLGLESVAARTEGFSGADLRGILSDAALFAERRGIDERETAEDVRRATALARASVSAGERRRLEAIYAAFAGEKRDDAPVAAAPKRIAHA